jgi:hypothetical protein
MPQGLQVWNAAGTLILDIGSRPLKLLRVVDIPQDTNTVVTITNRSLNTSLFIIPTANSLESSPTIVSDSGNSVTIGFAGLSNSANREIDIMEF